MRTNQCMQPQTSNYGTQTPTQNIHTVTAQLRMPGVTNQVLQPQPSSYRTPTLNFQATAQLWMPDATNE